MNAGRRLLMALLLWLPAACTPVVMPAGPASAAAELTTDHVVAADGAKLPLHAWQPDGPPRAVILALHGFNDYGAFFADAGRFFAEHGIASFAFDQRGFGDAPNRGRWAGTPAMVGDVKTVAQLLRARYPDRPLILFGESMGGAVALATMADAEPPPVDGVILSAPAVWGRTSMPWYQTTALWLAAHTMPWKEMTGASLGIRASDNTEMLKTLGRDPKVIKATRIDAVYGLVALMDQAMAAAAALDRPTLVLYGENDQLVPPGPIWEMMARMPKTTPANRQMALYADGWHMLLRDLEAKVVMADILAWIDDGMAGTTPLPSQADVRAAEAAAIACREQNLCASVGPRSTRSSAG